MWLKYVYHSLYLIANNIRINIVNICIYYTYIWADCRAEGYLKACSIIEWWSKKWVEALRIRWWQTAVRQSGTAQDRMKDLDRSGAYR